MSNKKSLYIDTEALSTLALVEARLISPVTHLMNEEEAFTVDSSQMYKGVPFPFSFVLAPKGNKNHHTLMTLKQGEVIDLINQKKKVRRTHSKKHIQDRPKTTPIQYLRYK